MWRLARRSVRANLTRYALTIISVVMATGFLSATLTLRDTLAEVSDAVADMRTGGDLEVVGEVYYSEQGVTVRRPIPDNLMDKLGEVTGIAAIRPNYFVPIAVLNEAGDIVTTGFGPTYLLAADPTYPRPELISGRYPHGADEIAVSADKLAALGLSVGETLEIVVAENVRKVTLVGTMAQQAPLMGITLMYGDPEQLAIDYAGQNTLASLSIFLEGDDGRSPDAINKAIGAVGRKIQGSGVTVIPGAIIHDEVRAIINKNMGFIGEILMVFVAVSLFIATFVIGNTFQTSVRREMRELALLRTLGARPAQISVMVLAQGAIIGVVGACGGLLGGWMALRGIAAVVAGHGIDLPLAPISLAIVAICLAVGCAVSMLGSLAPAIAAGRTSPLAALRRADVPSGRIPLWLPPTAVVLIGVGVVGLRRFASDNAGEMAVLGWAALALTMGVLAGLVLVIRPLFGLMRRLGGRGFGRVRGGGGVGAGGGIGGGGARWGRPRLAVTLAAINGGRFPMRTAATAGALAISLALMSAAAAVTASVKNGISTSMDRSVAADLLVTAAPGVPGHIGADLTEALAAIDGVDRVDSSLQTIRVSARMPGGKAHRFSLHAMDPGELAVDLKISVDLAEKVTVEESLAGDSTWVSEDLARRERIALGDVLELDGIAESARVRVSGIYRSALLSGELISSRALADRIGGRDPIRRLAFVHLDPRVDGQAEIDSVREQIKIALRPYRVFTVLGPQEMAREINDSVASVLAVFYAVTALASAVAIVGIANTLSLSVSERVREIGLLRVVGLARWSVGASIVLESIITSVIGALTGIALGLTLVRSLMGAMAGRGISQLVIPWAQLGVMLAVSVAVALLAAAQPAWRAARVPLMEAIAQD